MKDQDQSEQKEAPKIPTGSPQAISGLTTPEVEIERLKSNLLQYLPESAVMEAEKAYQFAAKYHSGQTRQSGEKYIVHPLQVAQILSDYRVDPASIIAAILHDVVEDTEVTVDKVREEFGEQVAELVDGMTKIGKIRFRSNQEKLAENFRKMVLAMARDLRVILIKLADRLHNMRTLTYVGEDKAERIARETLDIYAPLASRLGIYGIKSELEDLCLRYTNSAIYSQIKAQISAKKAERDSFIKDVKDKIENELKKYGFKRFKVYGRPKHFYSIYKKMKERGLEFEDIHDLFGFRILVDSVKDCYEALGVVHAMWKPMPGRFKDYIAMPKANLYQSLHTTVVKPNGEPAEIQIRTHEMQRICEFGVAAHWSYKEKSSESMKPADLEKFSWLRQIMEWQSEIKDPQEFLEAVKVDLFEEEIFIFTPKGDVFELPSEATALDFAFAIHTDIGLTTVGAKVNGRMVSIKKPLKSGDIVEILTSQNQRPTKDWLNVVSTSKAKNKIRSFLRVEERQRSREIGKELLDKELNIREMSIDKLTKAGELETLRKTARDSSFDDVLINIGYGRIDPAELISKAFPEKSNKTSFEEAKKQAEEITQRQTNYPHQKASRSPNGVLVSGLEDILVQFAKCCNPLPGENIIGFITRGRGVTVHSLDCRRANDLDPRRKIDVQWAGGAESVSGQNDHLAFIAVSTQDRTGVLAEITSAISMCNASVKKAQVHVDQDMLGVLEFELRLASLVQLNEVIKKIESIPSVVKVERRHSFGTAGKGESH